MESEKIRQLQAQLSQKERELYSIQKIGQALGNTLKLDDLLILIMKEITEIMDADRSTLYLVDHQKKEIWSKIALKAEIREIRQKFGLGISGVVAATGEKINIPDAYRDSRFDPSTDKKTGYRTRSILCIPVWEPIARDQQREIVGVIQVLNKRSGPFTASDEGILEAIGSEVAVALSNARLYQRLEQKYREIDLLYEFEQMLSAGVEVQEIFKNILNRTFAHLQASVVGAVFPLEGKSHLLALYDGGKIYSQPLGTSDENLKKVLQGQLKADSPQAAKLLLSYLPFLGKEELASLRIFPIELDESVPGEAALLFRGSGEQMLPSDSDDLQLLDIVAQKISRALELNTLRQSLLRQERLSAVGQMMSTIVHDLRSPVNSIYGFLELLVEENVSPEEKKEYADIMRMEIQSITNMTTEILDFAKGKTSILPRKCAVANVVKRFQPQAEQLFKDSGIALRIQSESKKLLYADLEKLTRVFYNIAKNAKEAMGDRGEFVFRTFDVDGEVVFELADNGPGIPEEIRDRLFESFVTSGKKSGTGLGLAIVKKIVEDHHGSITIESETGKGTRFLIRLPEYQQQ